MFLVIAPGTVAGYVPWTLTRWRAADVPWAPAPVRLAGGLLVAGGVVVLLDSFLRFALRGLGTPAPVAPTRHLVVSGLYRHVRNPMYVAVVAAVAGQALVLGRVVLVEYAAILLAAFHVFVLAYEEPTLRRTHGAEYVAYARAVRRWIPRLTPYRGGAGSPGADGR